jgi:AsmA protein
MTIVKSKRTRIILVIAGLVVLSGVALLPRLLVADTYRGRIEAALTRSLGRPVQFGHLSLSIFSGSLVADAPSIADDPAFSNQPFLTARQVRIGVDIAALLFHRELRITGFTIKQPSITLLRRDDGTWNYSSIGAAQGKPAAAPAAANPLPNLSVARMGIDDGTLTVGTLPASGQPHVYTGINLSTQNFSFTGAFPFKLTGKLPGGGALDLSGQAGPIAQPDASLTPVTAQLSLKQADLAASGLAQLDQGVSGIADLDAKLVSNGQTAQVDGKLHLAKITLVKNGSPSSQPVDFQFSVSQDLKALTGTIANTKLQIGRAMLALSGSYTTRGSTPAVQIQANGPDMPLDDLVAFLPSLNIQLPPGARLQGGDLSLALAVSGPTTAMGIAGPVRIANAQLTGFDLGSKLSGIQSLIGAKTGSNTTIQQLSTDLRYSPDGIRTGNLVAVVSGLGSASGSGTISPGGALDYHLLIKLTPTGGGGSSPLGLVSGAVGSALEATTKGGVPVAISGTTSNPTFKPELGKMVSGIGKSATAPITSSLGSLFGHKKQP